MARKDEIFNSFIQHPLISDKYNIDSKDLPNTLREGLNSEFTILKTIALIIESQEKKPAESENSLYTQIMKFLNTTAT